MSPHGHRSADTLVNHIGSDESGAVGTVIALERLRRGRGRAHRNEAREKYRAENNLTLAPFHHCLPTLFSAAQNPAHRNKMLLANIGKRV
jgi:hypothetical protein